MTHLLLGCWALLTLLWLPPSFFVHCHHRPWKWTFSIWDTSTTLQTVVSTTAPTFTISPCDLLNTPGACPTTSGPRWSLTYDVFYACPSSNPGKSYCNQPGHFYCSYWGCETLVTGEWTPSSPDQFLSLQRGPPGCKTQAQVKEDFARGNKGKWTSCSYLNFTVLQPMHIGWPLGQTWGIRAYVSGADPGGLFLIKKEPVSLPTAPMGPNKVLSRDPLPALASIPKEDTPPHPVPAIPTTVLGELNPEPLLQLVQAAYNSLNHTFPNLTENCWLCLDARPPYYDAIAVNISYNTSTEDNPPECNWGDRKTGLTIQSVHDTGHCIGNISASLVHLCAQSSTSNMAKYYIPPKGTRWLCSSTGLIPCVAQTTLSLTGEMCLLVAVLPHVLFHPGEDLYRYWESRSLPSPREKREPITTITVATIFGLVGVGIDAASFTHHQQSLSTLRAAVDEDLARIDASVTHLEKSLTSLSEVVLQNRRGLDLLFLKQGGLCADLGEECCFYSDHSGIVRESMTKLREGLAIRKQDREAQGSWYEHLLHKSPWLMTLISTLLGPLLILLLLITIGPCILNRLVAFIKDRINTVPLMVLRHQYQTVPSSDSARDDTQV